MSDETVCGRCRLPIHRDSPMQYFGTFVTHQPNECVRLLRAENERLRQDAKRYRWLRSQNDWRYQTYPGSPWSCHWTSGLDSEQVDAAIDTAMKEKNNES